MPRLIKSSLSNIEIKSSKTRYEAYYGRGIDDAIDIQVIDRKNSQPVSFIDMEVRFERVDGEFLSDKYQTDRNGRFKVNVTQINSKEEQQVIKASANLVKFKAEIDKGVKNFFPDSVNTTFISESCFFNKRIKSRDL